MREPIYIKAASQIGGGLPDPDFRQFLSPIEARRMSMMMKRAIATSRTALQQAGIEHPDAIITGTWFGSVSNTEALLLSLTGVSDQPMKPTHFMQSTHNTVGSLIGIQTGSHGYNATYSHGKTSFEAALLDAVTLMDLGEADNALVGLFDEMTPCFAALLAKGGIHCPDIAASFVLSHDPEHALCRLDNIDTNAGTALADRVLDAPFGYYEAVRMLADKECGSVVVANENFRVSLCGL